MAKEISMVDKSHQGKLARRYFIACEKRLSEIAPDMHQQELARWKQSRELAKSPFKSMNNALERMRARQGKLTARNHYINEINMLTGIVLKQSVKRFKTERNIQGDVREHLNANQLERLEYLERANEMLLDNDIHDFEERRFKLQSMLSNRFEKLAA
ncbi:Phage anti-repressor protein [Rodentibacter pneumotropicus]|nr:Phage anti-repressor protein [Rodentibacter pneumotropicus]